MSAFYEMSRMTSTEFARAAATIRLALLPVGATEQHGPNLALATDYVIAHRLAQKLAERLHPEAAVVVPPIPFGFSHHHIGFAGTITLSPETLTARVHGYGRSLQQNGISHLLLVNGHNGNTGVLNVIASRIRYELDMHAAVAFYFAQAADRVKAHGKTERYGHACEIETSVALYLAPELVRPRRAGAGAHAAEDDPARLQQPAVLPADADALSPADGERRVRRRTARRLRRSAATSWRRR